MKNVVPSWVTVFASTSTLVLLMGRGTLAQRARFENTHRDTPRGGARANTPERGLGAFRAARVAARATRSAMSIRTHLAAVAFATLAATSACKPATTPAPAPSAEPTATAPAAVDVPPAIAAIL